MKKIRMILSLILAVSVLMLAACSKGGGTAPEGSGSAAAPGSGSIVAPVLPENLPAGPSGPSEYTKDVAAPETTTGINQFVSETEDSVTFIDGLGKENTVKKYPQRVVIVKNCFLEMWYLVGGKAIARTDEIDYIPAEAMNLYKKAIYHTRNGVIWQKVEDETGISRTDIERDLIEGGL